MDFLISTVEEQKRIQDRLIERYEKELQALPEGDLRRKRRGERIYFYQQLKEKPKVYLSKKRDGNTIAALQRKGFLGACLPLLYKNRKAMDVFLHSYGEIDEGQVVARGAGLYGGESRNGRLHGLGGQTYGEMGAWYGELLNQNAATWVAETYESNRLFPEKLVHATVNGRRVRSKSEVVIANLLEMEGLSYRYEQRIDLVGKQYYPDFTILRPRDGKIIYWEHFGMIGVGDYGENMEKKLSCYRQNGIVPWDNFIATYDKGDGILD